MTTRTQDPDYDFTKARVNALTQAQFNNVIQRIRTVKARISPSLWLLAINSTIDLELSSGASPVPLCPPFNSQEDRFAALLKEACFVERVMNPYQTPNKQF